MHLVEHEDDDVQETTSEPTALVALVDSLRAEAAALAADRDRYKDLATFLQRELDRLNDRQKTPREHVDSGQVQLAFATLAEALLSKLPASEPVEQPGASPSTSEGNDSEKPPKTRRHTPHGRAVLPEHLPVRTLLVEPKSVPADATRIGEEISWRLAFRRASFYRLKIVKPVFVVKKDENAPACVDVRVRLFEGDVSEAPAEQTPAAAVDSSVACAPAASDSCASAQPTVLAQILAGSVTETTVLTAPSLDEMVPRGLPTPDLLARVFTNKFADKLPFHRQESIFAREGVRISRATMCEWAKKCHDLARLVVDSMSDDARLNAHYIATDATGVLVQANERCKHGHFWVLVAERDHVIFRYSAKHSSEQPKKFLAGFRGTVVADASNVYDALYREPDGPTEAGCWAHGRRYFYKALASDKTRATIGVGFCNELFEIERDLTKLPPDKRRELRRQRAGPVIDAIRTWREELLASKDVHDGTPLRRALQYLKNHWTALTRFLDDGKIPIHNNRSELELRRLVVGRANWLFVGSDESADWTCTFVSLVASCELHGLDPEAYLRDLFRLLPTWPKNRMLELAPKNWTATRARLDLSELELPLGPITIPRRLDVPGQEHTANETDGVHRASS